MTDLHHTLRISSRSCTNIIYDVRDDPILFLKPYFLVFKARWMILARIAEMGYH